MSNAMPPADDQTRRLIQTLQSIITRARSDIHRRLVMMYWEIGRDLAAFLAHSPGAPSLNQLTQSLSSELSIDARTLQHCHQFFQVYPDPEFSPEITWSQYRCLLSLDSPEDRRRWEQRIIREDLNQRDLLALLKTERLKNQNQTPDKILSEPVRGLLYHYRLIHTGPLGEIPRLMIDCGFSNRYDPPPADWELTNKRIVRSDKTDDGAYRLSATNATTDAIYTCAARLERVIDGDTLKVTVDCGFDIWRSETLRLKGIDTPEMPSIDGQRARDFVNARLTANPVFVIKTWRGDKYNRYLTDLFYRPGESDPAVIAAQGRYLNQELVDEKLAKIY